MEQLAPPEREHGPLVVLCSPAGVGDEARAPGLYYRDPARRVGPEVVFPADGEPAPELLARFGPRGHRPGALILLQGPAKIDPPDDMP